jgi:anti-sigma B factor antagonist
MTRSFGETVDFQMREALDGPGAVRLVLGGELDLAVAEMLGERLRMLRNQGYAVRVDLSELEFIDSSGLRELIIAVAESQSNGSRLDIDPQITAPVRRTLNIAGLTSYRWPDGG